MKRILLVLLFLFVFVLTACDGVGDRPYGIGDKPGIGRGVVSNIEPLNNGLYQIWIFGDSTYVYCTMDEELAATVEHILRSPDATIIYTYRDWKAGDPEFDTLDSRSNRISSSCGQYKKGASGSKLLSVEPVSR